MSTDERLALIERNTAEILGRDELRTLLDSGMPLQHYIGFEISGRAHLGTGLVSMAKVRDLTEAGVQCRVWLADWHTWINDKLGGDREVIRRIATGYFAEAMRASLLCVGGDPSTLEFVLASDLYDELPDYWACVIDVSKNTTLARMQRSISILGRQEGESVDFAKLIYPAMQAADIFAQKVHIAHAGMDQRKAHVIARDVATHLRINPLRGPGDAVIKPTALHHPLLLGLRRPPVWPVPEESARDVYAAMKMSKSDPHSAVFVHDSPDEIRDKIRRAFCPPQAVEFNPVLDWIDKIVFRIAGGPLEVARSAENGGPAAFTAYEEVADAYASGALHPMDAKAALSERLITLLEPARAHFARPEIRATLDELERAEAA
ncbi:MAG: tyrosine--tRNA ligase [Candidatus Dormibacteraeota bacterium]|nr:tyrosine--tRNA ligase [Candidatus Dormibacteraeota bacterium]MBV9526022.1 tyrosine--tRNA ligase [Candidatus Dormibacteraeota bacterium]